MNKLYLCFLGAFIFISCSTAPAPRETDGFKQGSGTVISIFDGDTFEILFEDKTKAKVRMAGIDAPEKGMPFYRVSKKFLSDLCFRKEVRLEKVGYDQYGRMIAKSYLADGRELGYEMIKAGLAWHFKKYSKDEALANIETVARTNKIGIWSVPNVLPPWEIRKLHRRGISTKAPASSLDSSNN